MTYTAIYLLTDDALERELRDAMQRVAELRAEQKVRASWSPEFRLSMRLHSIMCSHHDCDFNYQFGPNASTNLSEPNQYLGIAQQLTNAFTPEQIETLIQILSFGRLR